MSNDVNVNVKVTSDMAKANADAKTLHKSLKGAADAATATSKAVSGIKPASQTKAYASAAKGATTPEENLNYGIARSISTGTGAQGRDFAKQAQGLGGLVHVYATFAANLFAVGAAFSALKSAADTTNMIKGLDQLGAASGRNLGGLSKEVVRLTDGAVSLRDAMEAVGKASSSGMSDANIKRLATGASQASKVLGVGMADALSRLSRGIAKIEPELLDEIGIFVRVDKSAQDYARSLGKPVSALTDFEKRASFANAVLDQMDQKFGKIKMDANPYDKLLAGLKDVMQTGLEFVNKVLTPVVTLLASSPTGLTAVLAAVGAKLVSMAMPELNAMSKNRKQELDNAKTFYLDKVNLAKEAANEAKNLAENSAEMQMAETEAHNKRLLASDENALNKRSKVFKKTYDDIFAKLAESKSKDGGIIPTDYAALDKKIASLEKSQGKGKVSAAVVQEWKDAKTSLEAYVAAELKYRAEAELAAKAGPAGKLSAAGVNAKNASNVAAKALSAEISANAAYEASVNGIGVAWSKTKDRIKEAVDKGEMGKTRAGFTLLSSGIGAVTSRLSGLIGAFGVYGQVAALALAGLGFVYGMLTKTAKQSEEFNTAIDSLNSSTKNLSSTFEYASSLDPLAQISTDSLSAKATAILGVAQAIEAMTKKALAAQEATNLSWFDKENDKFLDSIDLGIGDKAAKALTASMTSAFEKLADDPKAKKAAEEIASTLGLKDLKDKSLVDNALEKTFKETPALFEQISQKIAKVGNELMTTSQTSVELKKSLEDGAKKLTDFTNSFIPNDKFSQIGSSIMDQASRATLALEAGPIQALASMRDMVSDPKFLSMFPPETAQQLLGYTKQIESVSEALALSKVRVTELRKAQEFYNAEIKANTNNRGIGNSTAEVNKVKLAETNKAIEAEGIVQVQAHIDTSALKEDFDKAITQKFIYGANIVGSRIAAEWAKVGSATTGVLAGLLGDTKEGADMRARMEQAQLSAQYKSLEMQSNMITALFKNTEELKASTALNEIIRLEKKQEMGPISEEESNRLKSATSTFKSSLGNLDNAGKKLSDDKLQNLLKEKEITTDLISLNQNLSSIQAQMAQLADQIGSSELTRQLNIIKDKYAFELRSLENKRSMAAIELETSQLVKLPIEFLSKEVMQKEAILKLELATFDIRKSELEFAGKIEALEKGRQFATGANLKGIETRISRMRREEGVQLSIANSQKTYNAGLTASLEVTQRIYDLNVQDLKIMQDKAKHELDMKKERLNTDKARADAEKSSGVVMPEVFNVEEEYRIKYEMLRQETEAQVQAIEFAKQEFKLKQQLIQDQYKLIAVQAQAGQAELAAKASSMRASATAAKTPEEKKAFNDAASALDNAGGKYAEVMATANSAALSAAAQSEAMIKNFDDQIARARELAAQKKKTLDIEKESALANARLVDIAKSLTGLFGESASKYMPAIEAFSKLAFSSGQYGESIKALNARQAELGASNATLSETNDTLINDNILNKNALASMTEEESKSAQGRLATVGITSEITKNEEKLLANRQTMTENTQEMGAFEEKTAKLSEDNTKRNINGTMAALSASKKMFKEKTAAFKIISALEKAQQLYNLVMMGKEIIMMGQKTIAAVTSSTTIAAAKTGETVAGAASSIASAGSGDPYTGIARVVAMIALMGVALAMVGKSAPKGGGGSFTANSEQKQAISGSGMSYNEEGKLVENGGGVFGDASAQSETVARSIEILKENSIDGLQYDNKMLKALERMADSLDGAAKGIYNIPGLRQGSAFTAIPESTEGYGQAFYGKVSHAAAWGKLAEVTGDPIAGFISNLGNTILNGVFGGKQSVSTKLVAAGVQLRGTILDLSNGADEAIRAYNDIKITTKTDGGWFGKDKTSVKNKRVTQSIEEDTREAIADVFTQTRELFNLLGKEVGYTSTQVDESLATINASADIDVKGLSGSQILEQINYVTSGIIDNAASVVFESLTQFREFGEAMGETAVRVVRDTQLVKQSLKNIGMEDLIKSITDSGLEESQIKLRAIEISEGLIDMAGGLDTFLEHVETYRENFLNDTERLAPIKKNVSDVMSELATKYPEIDIATVNTRHEFKQLVSALDVTTVKGMELFTSLMDVAEGFNDVAAVAEELASKVKLSASDFSKVMEEALLGKITAADIGTNIAQIIQDGILQALAASYIEDIANSISAELITPLITSISESAITGSIATVLISETAMESIIAKSQRTAAALDTIFNNAQFQGLLTTMTNTITTAVTAIRRPTAGAAADLSKLGIAASNFSSVLKDGILGNIAVSEIGEKVATMIEEGIITSLTSAAVDSITGIITQQIITPIITSLTTGAAITTVVSQASIDAMIDAAVAASRALAALFSDAGFMESIREVSTIIGDTFAQTAAVAQITSGTISKVLKKLSAGNTGLINAYKSQVTALESARQKFVDFAKTLREFAASLRLSDLSPLTPAEKYAQAQADFESTARLAQSGDETALGKLQSVSQSFLDISRGYYASTSQYTTDFNRVQQVLESSASAADAIVSDIDRQIGIAKSQLAVLGYIEENTADIASAIDKANAEVEKARQETKVAVADTLIRSFTTLDENVNGLLTKNELGALGLATDGELNDVFSLLDTNGDGQISLLETLNSSSKNTVMAVNDLNPILSDIRAGTRTTADAQTYLRLINEALVASGRSAIDGGSGYIDRGGSGTFTGGTDTGTGTGTGTNMYGDAAANRVSSIFRTLFNRSPDEVGLDYWSKSLRAGSSTEDNIFGNILAGAQGTDKGKAAVWLDSYITTGYQAILNRAPETGGLSYWKEKALNGAVHVKDLYRIIAQSASVGSNLNDKSSAQTWLAANPNYIAKLASGGRHSSGARIVGEQGPELEMTGPSRIWSFEQTRNMLRPLGSNDSGTDAELLAEIRKLNAKIDSLERTVAAGDMINADATERNTREVSGTVREATSTTIHASRMQKKATIV